MSELVTCTSWGSYYRHVAHVRPKCLWDDHTAISLLKVLQNCHNHARHSTSRRIQCVYELSGDFLCFLFAAIGGRSVCRICSFWPALQPQVVTTPLDTCSHRGSILRATDISCKKSMPELDGVDCICKLPVYGEVPCIPMLTGSPKVKRHALWNKPMHNNVNVSLSGQMSGNGRKMRSIGRHARQPCSSEFSVHPLVRHTLKKHPKDKTSQRQKTQH